MTIIEKRFPLFTHSSETVLNLAVKKIYQFLTDKSQGFILLLGSALVILVGVLDYVTGSGVEIDFFYLLPLFMVTWFASKQAGMTMAVLVTLVWTLTNKIFGQFSPNGLEVGLSSTFELAIFLTFVGLLFMLKGKFHQLDELAGEDPLTGLANRRSFNRMGEMEISRSQRFGSSFSVVYIDLDNFKAINDSKGHNTGDALLCEVAATIREHSRKLDTAARLGGDEFAILFPETGFDEARQIIEKIRSLLVDLVAKQNWRVTFSMGMATFSEPPASIEEMMGFVDRVMYTVKHHGKDGISFALWPDRR